MSNLTEKNDNRFVLLPIKYQAIWDHYKKMLSAFWVMEEIDMSQDRSSFENLSNDEKHFVSNILAFFMASDGIVAENLAINFYKEIQIPEARIAYAYQAMIEGIHSETYSFLIDTIISDKSEKDRLFNAMHTISTVKRKADWAIKWIDNKEASFEEKLIAFAVVEGIFFSSSFCAIYWLKKRGLMPGLTFSNELIAKDEQSHCDLASIIYNLSDNKLSTDRIIEIIKEAVEIECEFVCDSLPVELIGMNSKAMCQYIRYVADRLLVSLGTKKFFGDANPFDFMELISLSSKNNFFEGRSSEYSKSSVGKTTKENSILFNEDF